MPTVEWNKVNWNDAERWETEWKEGYAWGPKEFVRNQFQRFVAPWLPDDGKPRVLEIGCGMGRFTEVLLEVASFVHGIDLAEHCVSTCSERFPENFQATLTDGRTLPDGEFDLVVSWDSLVHAEYDAVSAYFEQVQDHLVGGGHVAIHHANRPDFQSSRGAVTAGMIAHHIIGLPHLELVSQTLFRFESNAFIDCFTVARRLEN
jgi:cyclopropane fatty-acyl-phospholipid synthase-like methyltransferase